MKQSWLLVAALAACAPRTYHAPAAIRVLELVSAEVSAPRGPATMSRLLEDGTRADVICLGEQHDEPMHHRVHAALVDVWGEQAAASGVELALGLEMFETAVQPTVDSFARGEIDWPSLVELSAWRHRWGHDAEMYRPLLEVAKARAVSIVALNAPRELTRKVAKVGLAGLDATQREALPELDLADAEHRRFFWAVMGGDAAHRSVDENMYAAQVIWDETMATRAAGWLSASAARKRRMVVVAGNGHCHASAIARRVLRRIGSSARAMTVLTRMRGGALPPQAASDYVVTVGEGRMASHFSQSPLSASGMSE